MAFERKNHAGLPPLVALLILPLVAACASGPYKSELDAEVKRLCAIDGGLKVYETVSLPAEKFNQWGQVNFFKPTLGKNGPEYKNALGPEYIYKWDIYNYQKTTNDLHGTPASMKRDHIQIIRKADMKLLGEVVMYQRAGGDFPGPWMPSSYRCPDILKANEIILMSRIFTKISEGDTK